MDLQGFSVKIFTEPENYFSIEVSNRFNNYCLFLPNIKGYEAAIHEADLSRRVVAYVLQALHLLDADAQA